MIAILSSSARERTAFAALCESRGWPHRACDSVRAFQRLLTRSAPTVVLMRHKLNDGYSDDVFAALEAGSARATSKAIVLFAAGTSARLEARQITLGADCVLRDPVRTEVLLEYLARYRTATPIAGSRSRRAASKTYRFAGAEVHPLERRLRHAGETAILTPREMELVALLVESPGAVLTYETLYQDILGRPFRGDTSNMRVLFAKLDASLRRIGISLRQHVGVIAKTGYRYQPPRRPVLRLAKGRTPVESAAA